MYPIRFEPIYQTYVWGGDRIAKRFGRAVDAPRIAESWEVSDRKEAMSRVANGPWKGKTLHELVVEMGSDLFGAEHEFSSFPLLVKIIDAKENLSVQVHPDETTAFKLGGEPKAEAWIMLDDGSVYAGLKQPADPKSFKSALQKNKPQDCLEELHLKKGEAVNIPGGRVHAICAGSLIYEVQQNSNTTYRLYDWGRSRELHLKEGLAAIRWDDTSSAKAVGRHLSSDLHHQIVSLVSTPYFNIERIDIFDQFHIAPIRKSFQLLYCLEGRGEIRVDSHLEPFAPGVTYLVPAACQSIDISGRCEALRVRLP